MMLRFQLLRTSAALHRHLKVLKLRCPCLLSRNGDVRGKFATLCGLLSSGCVHDKRFGSGWAPRVSGVSRSAGSLSDVESGHTVGVTLEGGFPDFNAADRLAADIEKDAHQLLLAVGSEEAVPIELSIVLCDDAHISELNFEYRSRDGPTDVLSFDLESPPGYPLNLIGDIVISVETSQRQADERRHSLRDECRVLLVHGFLHLRGYDHECSTEGLQAMSAEERRILSILGWQGSGLIAAAEMDLHSGHRVEGEASPSAQPPIRHRQPAGVGSDLKLLALDMDGTLLDSHSRVLPSSVAALKAALAAGVRVCLATGKARPAAIAAMAKVGLAGGAIPVGFSHWQVPWLSLTPGHGCAGDGLVISRRGPGLFLQGLVVHGGNGTLLEGEHDPQPDAASSVIIVLPDRRYRVAVGQPEGQGDAGPDLPADVVKDAFQYSLERQVPLAAFLGDECVTLEMHPELEELHYRYYEPLCRRVESLDALLAGPPVKKLLYMTSADDIAEQHEQHWAVNTALPDDMHTAERRQQVTHVLRWQAAVRGRGAATTMAVPNMLELLPEGMNKWVGMRLLLRDLGLSPAQLMTCGDGANDLQLVANSGIGIAMGNAVPQVKEAAQAVVADNDTGGIAEAVERFIL